jgi:cobalt/nickel transport system permease protein
MPVPPWLLREEGYLPRHDRDGFIDRSIVSLLGLLSLGRRRGGLEAGGGIDPFVKVVCTFAFLLLVSLTRSRGFLVLAGSAFVVLLAFQRAEQLAAVLATSAAVAVFTALILLPSALATGLAPALTLSAKVFLSVGAVRLVSVTSRWASLSGAFKRLHLPDLFILVFDVALRYIALLGDFALAMLHALRLRSVGRNTGKGAALAGIAGTLFLESRELAEELLAAMECRGFTGEYRAPGRLAVGWRDAALLAALAALAAAFLALPGSR